MDRGTIIYGTICLMCVVAYAFVYAGLSMGLGIVPRGKWRRENNGQDTVDRSGGDCHNSARRCMLILPLLNNPKGGGTFCADV